MFFEKTTEGNINIILLTHANVGMSYYDSFVRDSNLGVFLNFLLL